MLYWKFTNQKYQSVGAIAPEKLDLTYGKQAKDSPFKKEDFVKVWRAIESGYETQPSDCSAIRLISRYGYLVRNPADVYIKFISERVKHKEITPESIKFGHVEISGASWPNSESGYAASWIKGSRYIKIETGITILYPSTYYLFQGPMPNNTLTADCNFEVMSGIENLKRTENYLINNSSYYYADMNAIIKLPVDDETLFIKKGTPLIWFFPMLRHHGFTLEPLDTITALDNSYD